MSSFSTVDNGGAYTAGDFSLVADTEITEIRTFGFNPTSATPPSVTWHIYPDAAGVPAGNPDTNPTPAVWTFTSPSNGPGVTITTGGEFALDLVAAGQSLDLPQGTYWLTMFPTYANPIGAAGSSRWNWFQSVPQGAPSVLIGGLFGVTTWTPTGPGGLGTAIEDVAFRLTGVQGAVACGAPWLSINPTGGTIAAGQSQAVSVAMNPAGLADGNYTANVCIDSNDTANPTVIVPVTFTVGSGGGGGEANLMLTATDLPDPVGQGEELRFLVNVANAGPDAATDVTVEFALPSELSLVTALTTQTHKASGNVGVRGGDWTCADNSATVVCTLGGSIAATSMAPTLELLTLVSPSAAPGVVETDISVEAAETDPVPGNNSVSVETEITGLEDSIFANGFECAAGLPDCPVTNPDIVDSGPVNLVTPLNGDNELNFVTGQFGPYGSTGPGADINPYTGTGSVLFLYHFADSTAGQGSVTDAAGGTQVVVLQPGATIGPDSPITGSGQANMTNWLGGATGYIGVRFFNEETSEFNYGYVEFQTSAPAGFPAVITRFVYNSAGDAITIPTP